jgi:hypothetical protein
MVASAGLWPLSSPLAGQKRPPILPGGRFLWLGGRERPASFTPALSEGNRTPPRIRFPLVRIMLKNGHAEELSAVV